MGKEKKKGENPPGGPMASYLNQAESLKQEPHGGVGPVLALYLVTLPAMCLYQIPFLETDTSLKSMFHQSKLKSGTCFTKRKANRQGSHYREVVCIRQNRTV